MLSIIRRLALSIIPCLSCGDPPMTAFVSGTTEATAASTSGDRSSSTAANTTDDSTSGASRSSDDASGSASHGETGTSGTSGAAEPLCGDGVLDPGEECDRGAALNADDGMCLLDCLLATCGDGHVFAKVEECDDKNLVPSDGCHQCGRTRIIFVTSDVYLPGQFMGLGGADQRCRSLAAQAGLKNFAGFKAWLSDSKTSARDRMVHGRGRYELVNGLLVADSWDALVASTLQNPINATEQSQTHENAVWTATNADGTTAAGADHCLDWTYTGVQHAAHWGANSEISPSWTNADTNTNPTDCVSGRPIYCFEQN